MNDVNTLNYNGNEIKYVKGDSGVTYICLKDVCNILGLQNSNNVVKRVPISERQLIDVTYLITHDSMNNPVYNTVPTMFLSQDGLYMFLNTSRKSNAIELLNYIKSYFYNDDDVYKPAEDNDIIGLQNISNVRCYKDDNGEVFLNLEDIAYGLGFTQNALSGNITIRWYLVKKYLEDIENEMITLYGIPKVWYDKYPSNDRLPSYISENVFYRLAVKSNNQNAISFRAKVFDEILPMIRRTGMYMAEQVYNRLVSDPTQLGEMMLDYGRVKKELEDNRYKMNSYDKFMESKQSFSMATVAKSLVYTNPNKNNSVIGRNELFAILRDLNILQSGSDTWNMPYQEYVDNGYFQINIKEVNSKGNSFFIKQAKVLPKGIEFIINILNENGYSINNNDIPDEIN